MDRCSQDAGVEAQRPNLLSAADNKITMALFPLDSWIRTFKEFGIDAPAPKKADALAPPKWEYWDAHHLVPATVLRHALAQEDLQAFGIVPPGVIRSTACGRMMIWVNIRQTDTPQGSARSTPKPMIRRVNTSITTMTQWLRRSIDSQRNRSTLHRLSFTCPIKLSQDGPSVPASGR